MEALLFVVLFGFILLVVAASVVLLVAAARRSLRRAAERRDDLAALARAREWTFEPKQDSLTERFGGVPFGRGHSRGAFNVLRGRHDGREFVAFDHQYSTGSGEDRSTQAHSVVALNLGATAPDLTVGPTSMLRSWLDAVTGADIAIGDPAFDAHFSVRSPAPDFARELLLSPVRDVLAEHPQLTWRVTGDSLLLIRPGLHDAPEIESKLEIMDAFLDRVPASVWDRLRGEPAG